MSIYRMKKRTVNEYVNSLNIFSARGKYRMRLRILRMN